MMCSTMVVACGGASINQHPCAGLPTAPYTGRSLVLFGALHGLTKRTVCARIGAPKSLRQLSAGRQLWSYGANAITLTFEGDRVVATGGKVPIGG